MGLIYKYRECNKYTQAIFTTGCLHYSHPNDFNDLYDCHIFLDKKKPFVYIERVGVNRICLIPIDMYELQNVIQQEINDIEVCCFSKNGLQMQMWSHYANNHKGICLVFDEDLLLQRQHCDAREVIYQQKQVVNENIIPEQSTEDDIKFIYTKKKSWAYEQEIRYFHKPEQEYHNGNYPFDKQALKAIYFGIHCTPRNVAKYKNLCQKNGYNHVKFYQIKLVNSGEFEIEAVIM